MKYLILLRNFIKLYDCSNSLFFAKGDIIISDQEPEVSKAFTYVTEAKLGDSKTEFKDYKKVQNVRINNSDIIVIQELER